MYIMKKKGIIRALLQVRKAKAIQSRDFKCDILQGIRKEGKNDGYRENYKKG